MIVYRQYKLCYLYRYLFTVSLRGMLGLGLFVYLSVTYQIQLNIQIYIKIKHI